jgi:uncharacterized protein (TIGR03437 family)
MAVVMGAFAIVLWAYEYGPDPGVCGVPNENNTCAQSGCHSGTTNNPANKGSLAINFPNFPTYTPGVTQHLTVTISDPATTQAAWGFEVTARQSSNSATMTGTFSPNDQYTQIMCSQADLNAFKVVCLPGAGQGCNIQSSAPVCPANLPLQYMEHSFAGYVHTQGQGSGTYQFDWTPPSTNVGAITFYIAGNAGVAGVPNKDNDHIYATKFTLVAGSGIPPTLSTVQNGASFLPGFSQGSWITVIGTNLAATTRIWTAADFVGPNLPTQLDGASVTVDGKQAYIYYISPTQINALAPADAAQGSVPVQAAFAGLTSNIVSSTEATFSPAMFMFGPLGQKYVAAVRSDGQYIGPTNLYPGFTVPAQAGNIILLYSTGFGPTTPSTNFGETFSGAPPTANTVTCTIGGAPATVQFAGLVAPGEYQLNILVPSGLPSGDNLVVLKVGGVTTQANAYLAVQ